MEESLVGKVLDPETQPTRHPLLKVWDVLTELESPVRKAGEEGSQEVGAGREFIRAFVCSIPVSLLFAPGSVSPSILPFSCSRDCSMPEPFGQICVTGLVTFLVYRLQSCTKTTNHQDSYVCFRQTKGPQ